MISIQKNLQNFFIFDTKKDSIGYKQMFLNVKDKTETNIEDFVINNITTKKNKFNKNKTYKKIVFFLKKTIFFC